MDVGGVALVRAVLAIRVVLVVFRIATLLVVWCTRDMAECHIVAIVYHTRTYGTSVASANPGGAQALRAAKGGAHSSAISMRM